MVVQSELGKGSAMPTDPHHTPTILQSSSSQPQKIHKPRKPIRKVTQVPQPSDPMKHVTNEAVHKELGDSLVKATTIASSLEAEQDSDNIAKTQSKATPIESKSLDDEESLGEDASKQGRIEAIDVDEAITLVNVQDDAEMFDVDYLDSTATITIPTEEITLAQALEALKTSNPKVKGIVIQEKEEPGKSTTTTATIPKQQSRDKGRGIMIKEHVKPKKKDQIRLDEEVAKRLQVEFDEEERLD
uniref:Uncharacterized protein n=1 Tax=Tanacetum cinerariifolium TaxID=118510 RepID=A0A6L2MRC0_TANCI|nr:hypothetical protein [Tanacetum cinerariifolium]